jgi:hypothetical protein
MDERFSPCADHQSLTRMNDFSRALAIAKSCPQCYVEADR